MVAFFSAATVLLLAALGLVLYPLLRRRRVRAEDLQGDVVALSRERLEELKQKKQAGEISDAEYDAQARDLEAQLADDLHSQDNPDTNQADPGGGWIGIAVVVFVPVLSGLLYLSLGQPRALFPEARTPASQAVQSPSNAEHPEEIASMVERLAARLEDNPDDPEGWFMLARSYMAMQRYDEAADAFGRVRGLVGDQPEILVREATALALTQGGSLGGEPMRLVQRALDEQPDHPQALWLAATAAYQAENYESARDLYARVRPMVAGEQQRQVDDMLRDLAEKGYGPPVAEQSTPAAPTAAAASLTVNVTLAPSMQAKVDGDEAVFVFARAVNGPPMPLAVVRKTVAELPLTVTLDDSQAMTPQFKLSGFERVTVGARISSSGQPIAQPGDLEGRSEPLPTDTAETVQVTIDRVVPAGN